MEEPGAGSPCSSEPDSPGGLNRGCLLDPGDLSVIVPETPRYHVSLLYLCSLCTAAVTQCQSVCSQSSISKYLLLSGTHQHVRLFCSFSLSAVNSLLCSLFVAAVLNSGETRAAADVTIRHVPSL